MRRAACLLAFVLLAIVPRWAFAAELNKGDIVVVVNEGAEFVANDKTVLAELPKGAKIEVARVTAAAVGGYATVKGRRVAGWIRLTDVEQPMAKPAPSEPPAKTPPPKPEKPRAEPAKLVPVELEIEPFSAESFGIEGLTGLTKISDVAVASDGATWFATDAGPVRLADGNAGLHEPFGSKAAVSRLFAWKDRLWAVAPASGLACYEAGEWKTWPAADGVRLKDCVALAPDGAIWCPGQNCLMRFEDGDWQPHLDGVIGKVIFIIVQFAVAADGAVWGAVANAEPLRYQDGKYEPLQSKLPTFSWGAIETAPDGRVLVGFDDPNGKGGGLLVVRGDKWQLLTTENSQLPTDRITALELAPDGTLWLGFDGKGVARNVGDDWQFFPEEFRHNGWNTIRKIVVAPDGTAWVWGRTFFKAVPKEVAAVSPEPR